MTTLERFCEVWQFLIAGPLAQCWPESFGPLWVCECVAKCVGCA